MNMDDNLFATREANEGGVKYFKTTGVGSELDPYILHVESNTGVNHQSEENSSNISLGISGVFEGAWEDILDYTEVIVSVNADQASVENGLRVLWSSDGITNNGGNDEFTINANADKTFSFPCQRRYVKVTYANGLIAQSVFNLETTLKLNASKGSSHNIKNPIVPDDDAILTKSVISGEGDDGVFRNILASISGRLKTVSQPYTYAVSEGDLAGHSPLLKFGTKTAVAANTPSNIWEGNTALYAYMSTAQQLKVRSSSASDVSSGVGARTLTLIGLDSSYLEISETITMTGATVVTTTKSFIRIFRAYVETCGTSYTNVGKITITNNAGTVEQCVINALDGQTLMALWTVPVNKQAFIIGGTVSSDTNKGARVSLFTRLINGGTLYPWQIKFRAFIFGGNNEFDFKIPFKIPPKTDIEIRINTPAAAGTTSAGATFELWYEDI